MSVQNQPVYLNIFLKKIIGSVVKTCKQTYQQPVEVKT